MPGYSGFYGHDQREWLLAIGRRLRAEYDAVKEPVPERLVALISSLKREPLVPTLPGGRPMPPVRIGRTDAAIR